MAPQKSRELPHSQRIGGSDEGHTFEEEIQVDGPRCSPTGELSG
jgi:hypothetical protein